MGDSNAERIQKTYELSRKIFYLLKYSKDDNDALEEKSLSVQFRTEKNKYFIVLEGSELSIQKFFYYRHIDPKFEDNLIQIDIDSNDIQFILERKGGFYELTEEMLILGKFYHNYAFVPKSQNEIDGYDDKNVIIFQVKGKQKENLISEFKTKLDKIRYANNVPISILKFSSQGKNLDVLEKYLSVGKYISSAPETVNFMKLISSISNKVSPYQEYFTGNNPKPGNHQSDYFTKEYVTEQPFVFICASSGTGKTQLPFSINMPFVYLINNSDMLKSSEQNSNQEIYKIFFDISNIFLNCVIADRDVVCESDYKYKRGVDYNSMIAGFFVTLFSLITEYRKGLDKEENWSLSQIKALKLISDPIVINRITVDKAREEIGRMCRNDQNLLPLVFLDESQKTSDSNFLRDYKTLRKIIRNIGLIPVFMGTNANLVNFVNNDNTGGSREDQGSVWAYLIYKLAHPSEKFLMDEKQRVLETLNNSANRINSIDKKKFELFTDKIVSLLKYERPFFCNIVFKELLTKSVERFKDFDACTFFEGIILKVFTIFTTRKKLFTSDKLEADILNYNYCNLSITSPEFKVKIAPQAQNSEYGMNLLSSSQETSSDIYIDKACGIHGHIAHLFVDPQWLVQGERDIFFPLILEKSGIHVLSFGRQNLHFYPSQIFPRFKKETIGHLAFNGLNSKNNLSFISRTTSERMYHRISVNSAFFKFFPTCKNFESKIKRIFEGWHNLEILPAVSAIIASHYSGIKGLRSGLWLKSFLQELELSDDIDMNNLPKLKITGCSEVCKRIILNTEVPFCSPTIGAEWDSDFGQFLTDNGANLGVLRTSNKNEPWDFSIQRSFNITEKKQRDVILCECKFRRKGLDLSTITEIIGKLSQFESKINLIVTNKINESVFSKKKKDFKLKFEDELCLDKNFYLLNVKSDEKMKVVHLETIYHHIHNRHDRKNLKVFIILPIITYKS